MAESKPTPVRLSEETLDRLDRVAAGLLERHPGMRLTRSDTVRMAVERGLPVLEAELKLKAPKPKK